MKSNVNLRDEKKEYIDMNYAQVLKMCEFMNNGMSEEEAKKKALEVVLDE